MTANSRLRARMSVFSRNVSAVRTKTAMTAAAERNHERALWLEVVVDERRKSRGRRPRGREQRAAGQVDVTGTAGRLPTASAIRSVEAGQRRPRPFPRCTSWPRSGTGDPVGHCGRDKPIASQARSGRASGSARARRRRPRGGGRPRAGRQALATTDALPPVVSCTRSTSNAAPTAADASAAAARPAERSCS